MLRELSQRYYKVNVTRTSKSMGHAQGSYLIFDEECFTFPSVSKYQAWLKETYGTCKRVKMFRDLPNGQATQVGWIYCFKNEDWSHSPVAKWWQQDWVSVDYIKATPILI